MNGGDRFRDVPTDRILLRDLRLSCIIGVRERERSAPQDVVITVVLYADLRAAGRSDRLEDTVDYSTLARRVETMVEGSSFGLIEALAGAVAGLCLEDARVQAVNVRVEKPGALPRGRAAAVEIYREQEDLRPPMGFASD
jgi:FolB domain-containing protein